MQDEEQSQQQKQQLPSFWVPSFYKTESEWRSRQFEPITALELEYRAMLNEILNKPLWWEKMNDPNIKSKWEDEASSFSEVLSNLRFDYLMDELKHFAELIKMNASSTTTTDADADDMNIDDNVIISPTSAHGVWISDSVISKPLLTRLQQAAKPIELSSLAKNEWHAGSNNQVLDLIHPSDHCLVYGKTKASPIPNAISGSVTLNWIDEAINRDEDGYHYTRTSSVDISKRFQWLPSDCTVTKLGKLSIDSYINNLEPESNESLYEVIRESLEAMIPMFEKVLGSFDCKPQNRIKVDQDNLQQRYDDWIDEQWQRFKYGPKKFEEMKGKEDSIDIDKDEDGEVGEGNDNDGDDDDDYDEEYYDWEYERFHEEMFELDRESRKSMFPLRPIRIPFLPKEFNPTIHEPFTKTVSLKDQQIQIIVKMANIHLTSQNPRFKGGNWHLEGMENEAIIATGIVYHSMENITNSRLTFRQLFNGDKFEYPQNDSQGIEKVEPFELVDKRKPGHRKILAFFLVHPKKKIASTTYVPPQQHDWLEKRLQQSMGGNIPALVFDEIMKQVNSTMTNSERKQYAKELSQERMNLEKNGVVNR
ncbi:hypothetical protein HDU76_004131, partial [Blyttiomyces sp. JEL0837]